VYECPSNQVLCKSGEGMHQSLCTADSRDKNNKNDTMQCRQPIHATLKHFSTQINARSRAKPTRFWYKLHYLAGGVGDEGREKRAGRQGG
jgi:hypothetical protein